MSKQSTGAHARNARPEPDAAESSYFEGAVALWTPDGREALNVLRRLGLADDEIRRAGLGAVDLACPESLADGVDLRGINVPWRRAGRVVRMELRLLRPPTTLEGEALDYLIPHDDGPAVYPGVEAIEPGRPLIVTEWGLERIAIHRAVGDVASVVALGPAGSAAPDGFIAAASAAASLPFMTRRRLPADSAGGPPRDSGLASLANRILSPPVGRDWIAAALELGPDELRAHWLRKLDSEV